MASVILESELPVRPGEIIGGKYRIEQPLGKGGMGLVVSAVHVDLEERVAIKLLSAEKAADADYSRRFVREAKLAVKIKSPHVVRVLDVGELPGGSPFMVMELLCGEDLHEVRKKRGALPVPLAVEYVAQACEAAARAHELGIVHRDLKPSNLFLTEDSLHRPLVKVLDFGISKIMSEEEPLTKLTSPNTILGSLSYMSPEHIRSMSDVDERTDVWSLGVILYELLAGKRPFRPKDSMAVVAAICSEEPAPITELCPDLPDGLEDVILGCLQKNADHRIPSAEALAQALAPYRSAEALLAPSSMPRDSAIWRTAPRSSPLSRDGKQKTVCVEPKKQGVPEPMTLPKAPEDTTDRAPEGHPASLSKGGGRASPTISITVSRLGVERVLLACLAACVGGAIALWTLPPRAAPPPIPVVEVAGAQTVIHTTAGPTSSAAPGADPTSTSAIDRAEEKAQEGKPVPSAGPTSGPGGGPSKPPPRPRPRDGGAPEPDTGASSPDSTAPPDTIPDSRN